MGSIAKAEHLAKPSELFERFLADFEEYLNGDMQDELDKNQFSRPDALKRSFVARYFWLGSTSNEVSKIIEGYQSWSLTPEILEEAIAGNLKVRKSEAEMVIGSVRDQANVQQALDILMPSAIDHALYEIAKAQEEDGLEAREADIIADVGAARRAIQLIQPAEEERINELAREIMDAHPELHEYRMMEGSLMLEGDNVSHAKWLYATLKANGVYEEKIWKLGELLGYHSN